MNNPGKEAADFLEIGNKVTANTSLYNPFGISWTGPLMVERFLLGMTASAGSGPKRGRAGFRRQRAA